VALFFLTSRAGAFGSRLTTFFRTIIVGIIGIGLAGLSALQNLASDIGWISGVDPEQGTLTVDIDGRAVEYEFSELDELSLAYAASIHKAQGSEYPVVVIPLAMQHFTLLERNLLYTAVTRGRRLVVVIAEPKALAIAVKRRESRQRLTRLRERLAGLS